MSPLSGAMGTHPVFRATSCIWCARWTPITPPQSSATMTKAGIHLCGPQMPDMFHSTASRRVPPHCGYGAARWPCSTTCDLIKVT